MQEIYFKSFVLCRSFKAFDGVSVTVIFILAPLFAHPAERKTKYWFNIFVDL